jgi:hypothetical protein
MLGRAPARARKGAQYATHMRLGCPASLSLRPACLLGEHRVSTVSAADSIEAGMVLVYVVPDMRVMTTVQVRSIVVSLAVVPVAIGPGEQVLGSHRMATWTLCVNL